jgi:hypothetical protein
MASVIDETVAAVIHAGLAKEASGASDSRTRSWDELSKAILATQVVNLGSPTVLAGQGIRMLNGTPTMAPGNAPNANV